MTEKLLFDSATPWTRDDLPEDRTYLNRVKKAGGVAVSVYIRGTPGDMRHANLRDVRAARELDLGVVPNWESTADWFRTATIAECKWAASDALVAARALNFPDDNTIQLPFSWDYQIPSAGFARAHDQLSAIQDVLGDTYIATAYGQSSLLQYLHNHDFGDRTHWLMGSTWGLDYNIGQPGVCMVQSHHGNGTWFNTPVAGTDVNLITQIDKLAAWWPEGSEYTMSSPLTDDDADKVINRLMKRQITTDPEDTFVAFTRQTHADADAAVKMLAALAEQVKVLQATVVNLATGSVDPNAVADLVVSKMGAKLA